MRSILLILFTMFGLTAFSQVSINDTANNGTFNYYLGSSFKGVYPKGTCYLDRDASGAYAIKRLASGAQVTSYAQVSGWRVNGDTATSFNDFIEKVNGAIMLESTCGSTPVETFSYCGAPVWDFWGTNVGFEQSDTLAECGGGNSPICIGDGEAILHFWNSGIAFLGYNYGYCLGGSICKNDVDTCHITEQTECAEILSFTTLIAGQTYTYIDSILQCESGFRTPQSIDYTFDAALNDTLELNAVSITIGADTTIKNDIFIAQSISALRILGVAYTDINLDTANATIEITAKPVKTSGTTYEASSFKIEKIAFADISAATISGSTYNPNSGEQSNTFNLTTGKNTFKVSVEDTDGNVAYSIFQVSKTAL